MESRIYLYSRFERFWHWGQSLLIMLLLLTGFEVHGTIKVFGFERAVLVHNTCAMVWAGLYIFVLFWLAVTGEWRQYLPTMHKVAQVVRFYAYGIFKGEKHPVQKTPESKHNPVQRIAYLAILSFLLPLQIMTGVLYYFYNEWGEIGIQSWLSLEVVSVVHTLGSFALLAFLIGHVYMTTTGPTPFAYILGMLSGYEEVDGKH